MGAQIDTAAQEAWITGTQCLSGTEVHACELRGGAALIIAGLGAAGETTVKESHFIFRGYEDICGDLRKLGAVIETN